MPICPRRMSVYSLWSMMMCATTGVAEIGIVENIHGEFEVFVGRLELARGMIVQYYEIVGSEPLHGAMDASKPLLGPARLGDHIDEMGLARADGLVAPDRFALEVNYSEGFKLGVSPDLGDCGEVLNGSENVPLRSKTSSLRL